MAAPSHTVSPGFDSRRSSAWGQKQTALVIGGAGVVTLGVAGYFGTKTLSEVGKMSDYKNRDGNYNAGVWGPHGRAVDFQTAGFVLAGIGAALTGLAVTLYATAPKSSGTTRSADAPHLVVAVTPAAAFARGEW